MEKLLKLQSIPLTPQQLKDIYKKRTKLDLKVIDINKVPANATIEDLFDTGCFVLFVPVMSEYNGHYISMFINKINQSDTDAIFILDSYGNTPKELIEIIKKLGHVEINTNLFEIIKKSKLPVYCNKKNLQTQDESIADCGRFALTNCIFYEMFKDKGYDLDEFFDLLKVLGDKYKLDDADDIVTKFTSF